MPSHLLILLITEIYWNECFAIAFHRIIWVLVIVTFLSFIALVAWSKRWFCNNSPCSMSSIQTNSRKDKEINIHTQSLDNSLNIPSISASINTSRQYLIFRDIFPTMYQISRICVDLYPIYYRIKTKRFMINNIFMQNHVVWHFLILIIVHLKEKLFRGEDIYRTPHRFIWYQSD